MTGGRALWLVGRNNIQAKHAKHAERAEQAEQAEQAEIWCCWSVRGVGAGWASFFFLKMFIENFSEIVFGVAVWCSG